MSYIATSGVVDKIGEGITKAAGVVTQYQTIKAAASGQTAVVHVEEPFDWTPVLLVGGLGLAAYFLLRPKPMRSNPSRRRRRNPDVWVVSGGSVGFRSFSNKKEAEELARHTGGRVVRESGESMEDFVEMMKRHPRAR